MVAQAYDELQQQMMTGEQRESIWSVSKGVKHVYFTLFIGQYVAGTIWTVVPGVESASALWNDLSSLAITAAAGSLVVTETGRYLMVLAAAFEEWREKRRLAQIARAVHENNAEWEAWNQRRLQAEQRGEPFDEPLPSERSRATAAARQ